MVVKQSNIMLLRKKLKRIQLQRNSLSVLPLYMILRSTLTSQEVLNSSLKKRHQKRFQRQNQEASEEDPLKQLCCLQKLSTFQFFLRPFFRVMAIISSVENAENLSNRTLRAQLISSSNLKQSPLIAVLPLPSFNQTNSHLSRTNPNKSNNNNPKLGQLYPKKCIIYPMPFTRC